VRQRNARVPYSTELDPRLLDGLPDGQFSVPHDGSPDWSRIPHAQAKTIFRNLLDLSGKVEITPTSVLVTLASEPQSLSGGLRPNRSAYTHALVRQQKADPPIRLIGGFH